MCSFSDSLLYLIKPGDNIITKNLLHLHLFQLLWESQSFPIIVKHFHFYTSRQPMYADKKMSTKQNIMHVYQHLTLASVKICKGMYICRSNSNTLKENSTDKNNISQQNKSYLCRKSPFVYNVEMMLLFYFI